MPDFQLHIPQQGQQFPDLLRLSVGQLFTAQDEQVNVGKRMQLAPAIAADGHQGQIGNLPESGVDPQSLQQLVDKFGAGFNQLLCGNPAVKSVSQPLLENINVGFNSADGKLVTRPGSRILRLAG